MLLWRWKMIEILLIFFVVRWVLLTRILTRVKLSWPSTSSEWFSLTFNVYVRLCCDDSNPQDFFLSLQKSSGHIYLSQSVLILHVRTLGQDLIFGPKIKWKVEFSDILLSISIVFCAKIHNNDLWIFCQSSHFWTKIDFWSSVTQKYRKNSHKIWDSWDLLLRYTTNLLSTYEFVWKLTRLLKNKKNLL